MPARKGAPPPPANGLPSAAAQLPANSKPQEKRGRPRKAVQAFDERSGFLSDVCGSAIDDQKNLIWPREEIAEIKLMPWRAPVASTMGGSPFVPQVRPAW